MREFRILGPLEVLLDGQPVELGGQRQRALLAALLVHHGQVVSTERLVDLLWGEHAPKTATTSLQNAVSQLRRELGADVVETRAPGYIVAVEPDAIDAVRFEALLAQARGAPAAERAQLLRSALALWRGPALADLAGEEFTQGEIRRLEELRLDALEERIAADIELGLHREVIGELETLAASSPLRERVCALRMLALYRSGRQAEALQAFRDTRSAFVEELGIEPGAELQELHAQILRQEAGLAATGAGPAAGDVESEILRALLERARRSRARARGRGGARATPRGDVRRARRTPAGALGRVTQYVAAMQGLGPLHDELHALCGEAGGAGRSSIACSRVSRRSCASAAPRTSSSSRRRSTAASSARSRTRERSWTSSPTSPAARCAGRFVHSPPGAEPRTVDVPNAYADLSLERRTVLLRLRGRRRSEPGPGRGRASSSPRTTTSTTPGRASSKARSPSPSPLGCGGATCSSSATTSPTGTSGSSSTGSGAGAPRRTHRGRCVPRRRRSSSRSGATSTSGAVEVDENAFAGLLDGRLDGMANA